MYLLWVEKALWQSPPKTSLFPPIFISLGLSGHSHYQPSRYTACDINLYTPNIQMPILGIFHVSPKAMWGACRDREAPDGGPSPRHQRRGPETETVTGSIHSSDQFPIWAILREAQRMVFDACWCCPHQGIIFKEKVSLSHVLFHFQLEQNPREAHCPLPTIASPFPNLSYQPSTCPSYFPHCSLWQVFTAIPATGVRRAVGSPDRTSFFFWYQGQSHPLLLPLAGAWLPITHVASSFPA